MAFPLERAALRAGPVALGVLASPRVPAVLLVAIGLASALPAAWDLARVLAIAAQQLEGPAQGTDFLNLYAGARLFLTDPLHLYDLPAQHQLQQTLTERPTPIVPFFLPPYAALVIAPLALLPYGVAYIAWLLVNVVCLIGSVHLLAPGAGRWRVPLWTLGALLFLPTVLTLGQGQTALLLLLGLALLARGKPVSLALWALKPQLALAPTLALAVSRRGWTLLTIAAIVVSLTACALLRIQSLAGFGELAALKTRETFSADPVYLLNPTLLHASRWFLNVALPGLALDAVVLALLIAVWRGGPAPDDRRLLQLALLPLAAVLAAPYALAYELTTWLGTFWLLWRYTASRPAKRRTLLWLAAPAWLAANASVAVPREGAADYAALCGMCGVAFVAWTSYNHRPTAYVPAGERVAERRDHAHQLLNT